MVSDYDDLREVKSQAQCDSKVACQEASISSCVIHAGSNLKGRVSFHFEWFEGLWEIEPFNVDM